jgi:hypothetical protein
LAGSTSNTSNDVQGQHGCASGCGSADIQRKYWRQSAPGRGEGGVYARVLSGEPGWDRTNDDLITSQMLYAELWALDRQQAKGHGTVDRSAGCAPRCVSWSRPHERLCVAAESRLAGPAQSRPLDPSSDRAAKLVAKPQVHSRAAPGMRKRLAARSQNRLLAEACTIF